LHIQNGVGGLPVLAMFLFLLYDISGRSRLAAYGETEFLAGHFQHVLSRSTLAELSTFMKKGNASLDT
jgi:hypothetical protein